MIPAALILFALLDGAFAGFRASAGRDGRIDKRRYHLRAMASGASAAVVAIVALAALTLVSCATHCDPRAAWAELIAVGGRLVLAYGLYSALVLAALGVYLLARHEVRTLATVAILGPFTLARPWVVLGAAMWATGLSTQWRTTALTWCASGAVLAVGAWLHHRMHRRGVAAAPVSRRQASDTGAPRAPHSSAR